MAWQPTGGNLVFLEDRLRKGTYNGKPLYLHYTDESTWLSILKDLTLHDFRRNETRPQSKRGIYLCPPDVTLCRDQAWNFLFIGNPRYRNRGDYVIIFSFESDAPMIEQPTTHAGWMTEIIYERRELTFEQRDFFWAHRNPFIDVFSQDHPKLRHPRYVGP